jgi:putative transposase
MNKPAHLNEHSKPTRTGKGGLLSGSANAAAYDGLGLCAGMMFKHGDRSLKLERVHAGGEVELVDQRTLGLVRVKDGETGALSAPTVDWMREEFRCGRLHLDSPMPESAAERQNRFALLDPDASAFHDQKSVWRFRLAWRALGDEIKKTDASAGVWLDENYGKEEGDKEFDRPSPASLRRWMRKLEKRGLRASSLVSLGGRRQGQSQLEPFVDALVHEAALWYWARPRAQIIDAYAWLDKAIREANGSLPNKLGRTKPFALPSKEALRKRINKLRCYETVAAKEGPTEAAKRYEGSGEAVEVNRILQLAYMDATTLEQVITFDTDWQLPACKVRITALMDAYCRAIIGWHVYAGPNRSETSVEAVLNCMVPSDYPAETLAEFPELKYLFGRPASILPDNEKALIGPSSLPGFNEAGFTICLPPTEHPEAKACLERFFRSLKQALAQLPGTIIDPKRAKDLDYDGVEAASITMGQFRHVVAQVVASHNVSGSKALDGLSPLQVWMKRCGTRVTPAFENIADFRRLLGRTMPALLTTDGVELDGIRYRDAAKVQMLLDSMSHTEARRGQRKDGSATVNVRVRRSDGNIDTIDVYDTETRSYITLPSTQPKYTDRLSAWEHDYFRKMAKKRREPFEAEEARLRSKALTIKMIDELAPKAAFQQRRTMAAIYQSHVVDKRCGGEQPHEFPSDAIFLPSLNGESLRQDDALAPLEQAKPATTKKDKHPAPERSDTYGSGTAAQDAEPFDWESINDDLNDPETGKLPARDQGVHEGDDDSSEFVA